MTEIDYVKELEAAKHYPFEKKKHFVADIILNMILEGLTYLVRLEEDGQRRK